MVGSAAVLSAFSTQCHDVQQHCRLTAWLPTVRLSQIDNVKTQRLETLSRILKCGDGMRKAYEWIAQTKQAGRFRGPVFGPILLEVECQDQQHSRYLENQVSCIHTITQCFLLHVLSQVLCMLSPFC